MLRRTYSKAGKCYALRRGVKYKRKISMSLKGTNKHLTPSVCQFYYYINPPQRTVGSKKKKKTKNGKRTLRFK